MQAAYPAGAVPAVQSASGHVAGTQVAAVVDESLLVSLVATAVQEPPLGASAGADSDIWRLTGEASAAQPPSTIGIVAGAPLHPT